MDYRNMKHKFKELLESCIITKYNDYCIRLILQTRDIEEGKGLYELTYHMLSVLHYKVFHEKSFSFDTYFTILKHIVTDFKINEKKVGVAVWEWECGKSEVRVRATGSCVARRSSPSV